MIHWVSVVSLKNSHFNFSDDKIWNQIETSTCLNAHLYTFVYFATKRRRLRFVTTLSIGKRIFCPI